jgi:hypothetical protein
LICLAQQIDYTILIHYHSTPFVYEITDARKSVKKKS